MVKKIFLTFIFCVSCLNIGYVTAEANDYAYNMIDITGYATSKAYIEGAANDAENIHDYFMFGGTPNAQVALVKSSVQSKLKSGVLSDGRGVPYSMPLNKAITVQANSESFTSVPKTTVDLTNAPYEKIYYLAGVADFGSEANYQEFYVTINYTDGTRTQLKSGTDASVTLLKRDSSTKVEQYACTVDACFKWPGQTSFGTGATFNIYSYEITPTAGKIVDSVDFESKHWWTSPKILALTTASLSIKALINKLPSPDEVNHDNYAEIYTQILGIEAMMKTQNISYSDLEVQDADKINQLKIKIRAVCIADIEEMILALPDLSELTENNCVEVQGEIKRIREIIAGNGITDDEINAEKLGKLNSLNTEVLKFISLYDKIDISPYATSKVYLEGSVYDAEYMHDYFMYGASSNVRIGLIKSSVQSKLTDGVFKDGRGVPFSMTLDKVVTVQANTASWEAKPKTSIDLINLPCKKIYFLAGVTDVVANDEKFNSFYVMLTYTDGTTEQLKSGIDDCVTLIKANGSKDTAEYACTVNSLTKWADSTSFAAPGTFNLYSYEIITNENKVIDNITFESKNWMTSPKILAVTAQYSDIYALMQIVNGELSNLSALKQDANKVRELKHLVDLLLGNGITQNEINSYPDFMELYNKIIYIEKYTISNHTTETRINVEFSQYVAQSSISYQEIKVTRGKETLSEGQYSILPNVTDSGVKQVEIVVPHKFNYGAECYVILSKNIKNAADSEYSLQNDISIPFSHKAVSELSVTLTDNSGKEISSFAEAPGGIINIGTVLANSQDTDSQDYVITIGLYNTDGQMKQCVSAKGTIACGGSFAKNAQMKLPDEYDGYTIEVYAINSVENLVLICKPQIFGAENK